MAGEYYTYTSAGGGAEIRSYFTFPSGAVGAPSVVLLRGVAGPDEGYTAIAEKLAQAGFPALVHTWQVRGNDPEEQELVADFQGALAFLGKQTQVDSSRIALFGYCKGGGMALLLADNCPEVKTIVAFHGFARRPDGTDAAHPNHPIDVASELTLPVLLLHGQDDQNSPIEGMLELERVLKGSSVHVHLHTYAGVGHGFAVSTHKGYQVDAAEDGCRRAIAFLNKYLV